MLAHITEQSKRIDSQAQAIKWRDAKIESITFQLAKLKAWKFGAKIERMNAEQREIFEDTLAADQADLEAQFAQLMRQERSKPLWEESFVWLQLERTRVPDGSAINGRDPWAYLKDVLTRLPTQMSRIEELLPHRWQPAD